MKFSIRYRFTVVFIGLLASTLLVIWIINNWCLEKFYVNENVKVLETAYSQLDEIAKKQIINKNDIVHALLKEIEQQKKIEEKMNWWEKSFKSNRVELESLKILNTIRALGVKNNVRIAMMDSCTGTIVYPLTKEDARLAMALQYYVLGYNTEDAEILRQHKNYMIEKSYNPQSNSYFLESRGGFSDNQTFYIMSIPLSSIQDSAALSNRFLGYMGGAALLIGCVLVYFTTRKITLPIIKLAKNSEEMSNLNFEIKYEENATDEIGILGHSMNTLSDKLKDVIEELKKTNKELQKDIQEKIQIDEIRKEFIGNVSHELKTPIALIQGYAEGLTEGMCEDEDSRKYYCDVIIDEAGKMNKIVRQLLNLTALEFGNDIPDMECFDVVTVIQQLVLSTDILIQQSGAKVIIEAPEHCLVWADESKIEEVLSKYLSNALNHLEGDKIIRFQVVSQEMEVRISVFNTGKAIPTEDLPNIWIKFFEVDKARTRAYSGSGIGLSIVKAIIDAHHKMCGANNKEGGVEFWFTLDRVKPSQEDD